MKLDELLHGVPFRTSFAESPDVTAIGFHTRFRAPQPASSACNSSPAGYLFVKLRYPWLPGEATPELLARSGIRYAIVSENDLSGIAFSNAGIGVIYVDDVNRSYALACANLFHNASGKMTMLGITGTKGKTTTCHLVDAVLRHAEVRCGLISSVVRRGPNGEDKRSSNTTPEPFTLHESLFQMQQQGATHAVIEVSSIGIVEDRIYGLRFAGTAFTNLGTDHLDYHTEKETYFAAKQRLFSDESLHASDDTLCVINADDSYGERLASSVAGRVVTYGIDSGEIRPEWYKCDLNGISIRIAGREFRSRLLGEHNVYNMLAAFALTLPIVGSVEMVIDALRLAEPVPGRLERIATTSELDVFIDYARTPESVDAVLRFLRQTAGARRIVAVVGCSGNTHPLKRPLVGRAAVSGADFCIATIAHPRFANRVRVIEDMLHGIEEEDLRTRVTVEPDRYQAIAAGIRLALPDGILVVLGKGNERTQQVGGEFLPFDDREVVRSLLHAMEANCAVTSSNA